MLRLSPASLACSLLAITIVTVPAQAQAPLHQRIDQLIAAGRPNFEAQAAPLASDAEFLRRVYLDLTGSIPTVVDIRTFLDDKSPSKRRQVIERLLASPEHARHLQDVFDVMLMERRGDKYVPRAQWQEFLRTSFVANKPWDQLVREIMSADGIEAKQRPAAKFYLEREAEPNIVTRDISRLFLGMNLQCAQCHDHPVVDDYKQDHFQGVFAFLNRTFIFAPAKNNRDKAVLAEKAEGEVSYQSVFDPAKVTKTTMPRMPGRPPVAEPKFDKGKEYSVAPAKDVRPVPKFSRRAQLAQQITDKDNVRFRRNIANRLWAMMMGRGLVHPVDFDHTANAPSHPELLTLLADEFAVMKFDIRTMLRELALTKTYQRASEMPVGMKELRPETFAVALLRPLSPEQFARGLMQATGFTDSERKGLGKNLNEQALHARLAGGITPFIATFGAQAGQPEGTFEATIDQTLFLANGDLVRGWLAPRSGNLLDRLTPLQDSAAVADELYLSVLTRRPVDDEKKEIADYLKGRTRDRVAALQELAWALVASAEFRFNH